MSEKLKPCPFCGSDKLKIIKNGADWNTGVECKDCELNIYFFEKGHNVGIYKDGKVENIIKAWNRRPK